MGISIAHIDLAAPVILAPMSGVTDRPFRDLVRGWGVGLVVTEMIASAAVIHAQRKEMRKLSGDAGAEHPLAVQLAGWDPATMAAAARLCRDRGAAIIDINMGCPAKKVVNKLSGSALMRDEDEAARIIASVVAGAGDVPVTLKMRTGWDEQNRNAPRIARRAVDLGVQLITVHGRSRAQKFTGHADWRFIAEVKAAVDVPVVANGDIVTVDDAQTCLAQSRADGVMIGRGAYGRPWFPAQVAAFLATGERRPDPTWDTRRAVLTHHLDTMLRHYGRSHGLRLARKHIGWYALGLPQAAAFRQIVNNTMDEQIVFNAVDRFFGPDNTQVAA